MTIQQIYNDYLPDNSIWSEEEDKVRKVKNIVFHKLTEADRRIILLYADLQSLRKLGKMLGISTASACITVQRIRKEIQNNL